MTHTGPRRIRASRKKAEAISCPGSFIKNSLVSISLVIGFYSLWVFPAGQHSAPPRPANEARAKAGQHNGAGGQIRLKSDATQWGRISKVGEIRVCDIRSMNTCECVRRQQRPGVFVHCQSQIPSRIVQWACHLPRRAGRLCLRRTGPAGSIARDGVNEMPARPRPVE